MLIQLLVLLIILGLIFWAVRMLTPALGIPAPVATVIYVIMVVIAVLWLLRVAGLWTGALP